MPGIPVTVYYLTADKQRFSYQLDDKSKLSFFQINRDIYLPANNLGQGSYSKVQRYQCRTGKSMAVKTSLEPMEKSKDLETILLIKRELTFMQEIHSAHGFFHLLFIDVPPPEKAKEYKGEYGTGEYVSFFMFLPYFEGMTLARAAASASSRNQLIHYSLSVATEIDRIHNTLGIIHNDAHGGNFIISPNGKTYPIDPMLGARIGEPTIQRGMPSIKHFSHLPAPETWTEVKPNKAHPSLDVYGFSTTILSLFTHATRYICSFDNRSYPQTQFYPADFLALCQQGISRDPKKRPTFKDLTNTLKSNYKVYPQTNITFRNFIPQINSPSLLIGYQLSSPNRQFKSHSGFYNYLFHSSLGPLRLKIVGRELKTRHVNAILHQRIIYPLYADLFQVHTLKNTPGLGDCSGGFYLTFPYYAGVSFKQYEFAKKSELQKAGLFLAILLELKRIHDLGFLNLNINGDHIIIEENKNALPTIHFTNFDYSSRRDAPYAYTEECKDNEQPHRPEELKKAQAISPRRNQEMRSLGYTFAEFKDVSSTAEIIRTFSTAALALDPKQRPQNMDALITRLKQEIEHLKTSEEKLAAPAQAPMPERKTVPNSLNYLSINPSISSSPSPAPRPKLFQPAPAPKTNANNANNLEVKTNRPRGLFSWLKQGNAQDDPVKKPIDTSWTKHMR